MPDNHNQKIAHQLDAQQPDQSVIYELRLEGHVSAHWRKWFGGLTITLEENGHTLLTGPVVDQAELHSLLRKVRDLGMTLLAVQRVHPESSDGVED